MRIAILHAEIQPESSKDEQDVLVQVDAVAGALKKLHHDAVPVALSLDLGAAKRRLQDLQPDLVFNLVESVAGIGQFIHFAPALLDHLHLPYTGSRTNAVFLTTNKVLTKERLQADGILTPQWLTMADAHVADLPFEPPYILKPVSEDASVGLDGASLVYEKSLLSTAWQERVERFGSCFVEAYIHGREFNISMLANRSGAEVLPPAEVIFREFPQGKPHIVDYRAKWEPDSLEYRQTVRSFEFPPEDAPLIEQLCGIALRCWRLFDLHGYARIDFRVDNTRCAWVLEVNVNPCISPDSGFVAATEQAGLPFEQVIHRIIQDSGRS